MRRLARTLMQGLTLTQQAHLQGRGVSTIKERHRQLLMSMAHRPFDPPLPLGKLILIVDGLWFRFGKERWTLYLMVLRSVEREEATFLRPILRPGRESQEQWQKVVETIPAAALHRICAFVSDSLRGIETIPYRYGWHLQRCHFHLLAGLQAYLGSNKKRLRWRCGRRRAYEAVRTILTIQDLTQVLFLRRKLARYAAHPLCPRQYRMRLRELLRRLDEYRTYLNEPNLHLPATTNVIESMNAQLRVLCARSRGFRTPQSLERWAVAYVRLHPTMNCRPKNLQN